jgi:hypothetical protein
MGNGDNIDIEAFKQMVAQVQQGVQAVGESPLSASPLSHNTTRISHPLPFQSKS